MGVGLYESQLAALGWELLPKLPETRWTRSQTPKDPLQTPRPMYGDGWLGHLVSQDLACNLCGFQQQ